MSNLLYPFLAFICLPSRQPVRATSDPSSAKDPLPRISARLILRDSVTGNIQRLERRRSAKETLSYSCRARIDASHWDIRLQDHARIEAADYLVSRQTFINRHSTTFKPSRFATPDHGQSFDTKRLRPRFRLDMSIGTWQLPDYCRRLRNRTRRNSAVYRLCGVLLRS